MFTRCQKNTFDSSSNLFLVKRFVFKKEGGPEAQAPAGSAEVLKGKEGNEPLKNKYEKNEAALKEGVAYNADLAKTMEALAAKIDGTAKTQAQITNALKESYDKYAQVNNIKISFDEFWKGLGETKCKNVSIVQEGGKWIFRFKGEKAGKEKVIDIEQKETAGIAIDQEKPAPSGEMRMVDAETEAAEQAKLDAQAKGRENRSRLFKKNDAVSGTVQFKDFKDYMGTKITDIYPDAQEGDRVEIRRYGAQTPTTVEFTKGEWRNVDTNKKTKVTIEFNDQLTYSLAESRKESPEPPPAIKSENLTTIGYYRVKENTSWTDIARTIMYDGGHPRGEDFVKKNDPDVPRRKEGVRVYADSPQMRLEGLDYDYTNDADVKAYAELLKKYNAGDKKFVWVVVPKEKNPRVVKAEMEKQKKEMKKADAKRDINEISAQANLDMDISKRYKNILLEDKDVTLKESMVTIVNDEALWNEYWNKGLIKGKETIMHGFEMLMVPPDKARKVMYEAITIDNNDIIQFSELLSAFKSAKLKVFTRTNGEIGDYGDFVDEYKFFKVANKRENGQTLSEDEQEIYDDNKSDYLTKGVDVLSHWADLNRVLDGCAIVMDGVNNMAPSSTVEDVQRKMDQRAERKEKEQEYMDENKVNRVDRGAWVEHPESEKEDAFLQQFFHPANALVRDDISDADEVEKGSTDFENRFSEAEAYRMICFNADAKDAQHPGKIDRGKLAGELNTLVAEGLTSFIALYKQATNNENLKVEVLKLAKRYYGAAGEELKEFADKYGFDSPDFMQKAMAMFGVGTDLKINEKNVKFMRNLMHDGFASQRLKAGGEVKENETKQEWKSYSEIVKGQPTPLGQDIVKKLEESPKFQELSDEEKAKVMKQVNEYLAKDHTFEKTNLFNINAGFDANSLGADKAADKNLWVGLSTDILALAGVKELSLQLGFAVNPINGQVMVGAVLGKDIDLGDQWKLNLAAGIGVEVTQPALVAGASAGLTWMSKGSADSAWRTKVNFGAGIGSSISLNLTDVHLGPYLYVGAGEVKDFQNQYKQMFSEAYVDNGLQRVDDAGDVKSKAAEIQRLPHGVGELMTEVKYNMHWTDQELVKFYEERLKKGLKEACFKYVVEESASGLTEWGVGITIDPVGLLKAILTLGGILRLGFAVSTTINVKRDVKYPTEQQMALEKRMIADYEKAFPGLKIQVEGESYNDMEMVKSREFAGGNLERIMGVPEGRRANRSEFSQLNPSETKEFKDLQKQFADQRMELTIDPETKMYSIRPTSTEAYRVYIDRGMANGNGMILKKNQILIASGENLTDLFIKRFDNFYPGEVDGSVQHTIITISDNPNRTITEISSSGAFVEVKYDRDQGNFSDKQLVGKQKNVMSYADYQKLPADQKALYYTSENRSAENVERRKNSEVRKGDIEVTGRALGLATKLETPIDLKSLKVSPEAFMKKYPLQYRQLSTNPTPASLKQLDETIRKENPGITQDQLILYKERLFHLSMSEIHPANEKQWVEERLQWAETNIYTPFFSDKLKTLQPPPPPHITGKSLARAFITGVRQHLKDSPVDLEAGQSIFTAVGTNFIEGIRKIEASTGENKDENKFRNGFDYSQYLSAKGENLTEEQRWIARVLLEANSEIPKEDSAFLKSRLAKKLFYLGTPEIPNPLINILTKEKFEKLIAAYAAIEKGETLPADSADAVKDFRRICEKVRDAQLGNGVPTTVDGTLGQAVLIGDYYFVIQTTMKSGYYEKCRNPSAVYNEKIFVYERAKFESAPKVGMVAGGAGDAVALESRSASVLTLGIGVVGVGTVDMNPSEGGGGYTPPDDTPPHDHVPARPRPGDKGEVIVDDKGPGTDANPGDQGSQHPNE